MQRGVVKYAWMLILTAGLFVSGCASTSPTSTADNDPYEATNRNIFALNQEMDKDVALPVAKFYVRTVPEPAREGVHNFIDNLNAPVVFANDVLQGDVDRAGQTLGRFSLNSTLGIGGLIDVASKMGIPYHETDFGITLGMWGFGEGPFLMLPVLGPAPPRDLVGKIVDFTVLDPTFWVSFRSEIYYEIGLGVLSTIDLRAQNIDTLESIERTSVDYYATIRNLYLQSRKAAVNRGKPDIENLPNF